MFGDQRLEVDLSLSMRFRHHKETAVVRISTMKIEAEVNSALVRGTAFEGAVLVPGEGCAPLGHFNYDGLGERYQPGAVEVGCGSQQARISVRVQHYG